MNASQIHLALNHVPLFFSVTGGLILLFGMFRKNVSIKILSFYFMIAAALFTVPVYLTGEGTEEAVEKLTGISESLIEKHETMANIGLVIIIITGVLAIIALLVKKRESLLKIAMVSCAVFSFASFGVMAQTSHLGGQIRHSEIRSNRNIINENGTMNNENGHNKDKQGSEKDDD